MFKTLLIALGAMFLQQTFVAIGRVMPAVLAPVILLDLHYDPAWVGVYFGIIACAALLAQMGCGSFIVRYGPLRMSQAALVMLVFGMAISVEGSLLAFAISAIIGGGGAAVSTPTSSQLLGKVSPPRMAPLVFSIKQTAVPAGLLFGGALGPLLANELGWRGTTLAIGAACLGFVFMLQPLRARFDRDRVPTRRFRLADLKSTITSVVAAQELRSLSFACFAFNGIQATFTAYFVIYLTHLGYSLVMAGFIFSTAVAVAIPGRILWGWLGSFHVEPRLVMAGLALGMSGSVALSGFYTDGWPLLAIGVVAAIVSASALSWHGILLAETARLAPSGMAGAMTGGVLSFGQLGALLLPLIYSALLSLTGSYGVGFIVCSLPALLVGIVLLRQGAVKPEPSPST